MQRWIDDKHEKNLEYLKFCRSALTNLEDTNYAKWMACQAAETEKMVKEDKSGMSAANLVLNR